jgi:hypothetical protein
MIKQPRDKNGRFLSQNGKFKKKVSKKPQLKTITTHIVVVMDRSGSMDTCRIEAENGLNEFIGKQKGEPGNNLFTLVQFDAVIETVYNGVILNSVGLYKLYPRSMTALLDAIGKTIEMVENQKADVTIFTILTDGLENASYEFKRGDIKRMIEEKTKEGWKFTFLAANQDAFLFGDEVGISKSSTADFDTKKSVQTFSAISAGVSRVRNAIIAGASTRSVDYSYTQDERKRMA